MTDLDFFGDPLAAEQPPPERGPMTEAACQARLLSALRAMGAHAFRVSVLYSERAGRQAVPDGTPDVYAHHRGVSWWIECKTDEAAHLLESRGPKTKTELAQERWRRRHERAGGKVVRCYPAVLERVIAAVAKGVVA